MQHTLKDIRSKSKPLINTLYELLLVSTDKMIRRKHLFFNISGPKQKKCPKYRKKEQRWDCSTSLMSKDLVEVTKILLRVFSKPEGYQSYN